MTTRSPLLLGLAALALTTLGMAMGAVPPDDAPRSAPAPRGAAFTCELSARDGDGVALAGRLVAREAVTGSYALRVRSGGVAIDQGGDFAAAPGETVTLGEAMLGAAPGLDARLTLTVGGRETVCPLRRS